MVAVSAKQRQADAAQAARRQHERVEELCAAAIRALSGEADVHFRGGWLHRERALLPMYAPHLHPSPDDDYDSFRGAADGMALRLVHSDAELHRTLRPSAPVERLVFEMLEQFRVEALASREHPGVVKNLRHRHVAWSLEFYHSGLTETSRGILIYTVAQVCRSRVTREPVVEETEDLLETTRGSIVPLIGDDLAGLRRHRNDQPRYALHALGIAHTVGAMIHSAELEEGTAGQMNELSTRGRLPLFLDAESDSDPVAGFASGGAGAGTPKGPTYRVFTSAYDLEQQASSLVRPGLLKNFREKLDQVVTEQRINVSLLARELRWVLAEPAVDGWDGGLDTGLIDGRRLSQLISSPTEHRLFRMPRTEPLADCVLTILVDCSGSMKQHSEQTAVLADTFARALELVGGRCEVLGFTTGAWNGGRAVRDWRRAGRPARPGRLNERRHIVFKDAATTWRRARHGIAALLRQDLYRESIDGEAVDWACQRLEGHDASRRLLVVVSDGAPMDSATALHNDGDYLDRHLIDVVQNHEHRGAVGVYGLGVGLDLSRYYSRSHAIDMSAGVDNGALREVVAMIAGAGRR